MLVGTNRKLMCVFSCVAVATLLGASAAQANVYFDGTPGTDAPPPTLGKYSMTPFPDDTRPIINMVSSVDSPLGGVVGFTPDLSHRETPGGGWATWSHGYTGDVYFNPDSATPVALSMPPDTGAFYFYVEPDLFALFEFEAVTDKSVSSGTFMVQGDSGAKYVGFYADSGETIMSITVTNTDGQSSGFAVGEFGIATVNAPIPTVSQWGIGIMGLLLLVGAKVYFGRRRRAAQA